MIEVLSRIDTSKFMIKRASLGIATDEFFERLRAINRTKGAVVQAFDLESVADRLHLTGAYANAILAFNNGSNRTKSMAMEMLLFAAMTDQIGAAVDIIGIKECSDIILFSNSKKCFEGIRPVLRKIEDFRPTAHHTRKALRKFGIRSTKDADRLLLQRMAMSRLKP